MNNYPEVFQVFLEENPHLWKRFEEEANKAWDRGLRQYSSKAIVEYIRHETPLYERNGAWKISNNHTPWLSRHYIALNPDRATLFKIGAIHKKNRP